MEFSEKELKLMEEATHDGIQEAIYDGDLELDKENGYILYTEEWLDEWLESWKEYDWTDEELKEIRKLFCRYTFEREEEKWDTVYYEDCNGGIDWYEENERIELVEYEMKKIA